MAGQQGDDIPPKAPSPPTTNARNSLAIMPNDDGSDGHAQWCPDCGQRVRRETSNYTMSTTSRPSILPRDDDEGYSTDDFYKEKPGSAWTSNSSSEHVALPMPAATVRNARYSRHREIRTEDTLQVAPQLEAANDFDAIRGLSMFDPHPAVRPKFGSIWGVGSRDFIPLGTDSRLNLSTPAGTIPTPASTSGLGVWHERLFIFNIILAQIFSLGGLAQTVAPILLISHSLGVTDPGQMSWFTSAYSLTLGTFILPAGRLGDMYGHKKLFILGWIWFAATSLLTGFSYLGGPIMLATMRGLQGIGPALLVPNGIALIARTFPIGMKRGIAIAIFGGCGPVGFILGATFSSLFAQLAWWPWCWWAMAIGCAASCVLTIFVIPSDTFRATPLDPADKSGEQFDLLGSVTGVAGLMLINFALNQAPVVGWNYAYNPVLLVVGFLLMGAFVYIELKVAARPIVPLKGLHREAAFTLACIAAGWASHGIWLYYLFLFLENIRHLSALAAAAQTWPVAPIGFCAAVAVPFILKKVKVPFLMSVSMLFFFIGTILLITAPVHQSYFINTMLSILIMPFAMNWSFPSGTILMANAVAKQHQGIAASLITTTVNYSIATGLGIAGTIDRYTTHAHSTHGIHAGYINAWWFGVALSLTGFLISLYFIWQTRPKKLKLSSSEK